MGGEVNTIKLQRYSRRLARRFARRLARNGWLSSIGAGLGCGLVYVALVLGLSTTDPQSAEAASIARGPNSLLNTVLPIADWINNYPLTADDDQTITVPAGADLVVWGLDGAGTFWIKRGASCAVPVTTITNGTGAEPNPSARRVAGGQVYCAVTADTGLTLSASYYRLGN